MSHLEVQTESHDGRPNGVSLESLVPVIWGARKGILVITALGTILAAIVNFFLFPVSFLARATLLPQTEQTKVSFLNQIADIAHLTGVSIPGSEIARLYPSILTSETVLKPVIERTYKTEAYSDSVNLILFYGFQSLPYEEALDHTFRMLRESISSSYDSRTNIVTVTLEMPEGPLVATVLNALIEELDSFMRKKRFSTATEQVKWIDVRLEDVGDSLLSAEQSLKIFREKNRRVMDSPELLLRQERLVRQVQISGTLFAELKKQHELAKIEEVKNVTMINILDPARAPVRKYRPRRLTNTAIICIVALFAACTYYAAESVYGSQVRAKVEAVKRKLREQEGPRV